MVDAYLSDAITREIFTRFPPPLAAVTTATARPAAFSLFVEFKSASCLKAGPS